MMDDWSFTLGFICADLDIYTGVSRDDRYDGGFKLRKWVSWKTLFVYPRNELLEKVEEELENIGIELKQFYYSESDIKKWFHFLKQAKLIPYFSQAPKIELMEWVFENPLPTRTNRKMGMHVPVDFEETVKWMSDFDILKEEEYKILYKEMNKEELYEKE
jgi:hypothetical protein